MVSECFTYLERINNMKTKFIITGILSIAVLVSCNKEERLMKRLEGNWRIDKSVKTIHYADGHEEVIEDISDAGKLILSEGSSDNEKQYDFLYIDKNLDTMRSYNVLVTDEYNNRMIMTDAYTDTTGAKNIVWTIEKEKKNKQVWSTYGVDSVLFYPSNNHNPGAAGNWVVWTVTLRRE